jgi:hypothetical protein
VARIQAGPRKKTIRSGQSETFVDSTLHNNRKKSPEIMKPIKSFAVAMAGLALSVVTSQAQLSLNFASTPGATIQFNGTASSFQFDASTLVLRPPIGTYYVGSQWSIGSETGGTGSALGLLGVVNNSPFSYGPITTVIAGTDTDESAYVTGPLGALAINDGVGNFLTGNVDWMQVATFNSAGAINALLTINVTGLAYAGINADLLTLVADGPGSMNVSFQFSPSETLSQLTSGSGPYNTSFSGSISVVPEPSSFSLFGFGGALAGLLGLVLKKQTQNNQTQSDNH